jgi:hypothetical protein
LFCLATSHITEDIGEVRAGPLELTLLIWCLGGQRLKDGSLFGGEIGAPLHLLDARLVLSALRSVVGGVGGAIAGDCLVAGRLDQRAKNDSEILLGARFGGVKDQQSRYEHTSEQV